MAEWYKAKLISSSFVSEDTKALTFKVPGIKKHVPGQYYSIRIINSENNIAGRIYSAANKPNDNEIIELGVQVIIKGEISPYLHAMKLNDEIEIKGPLGEYFVVEKIDKAPLVLICGGVGIVPFMSIMRSYRDTHASHINFLGSFRSETYAPYFDELKSDTKIKQTVTFTRNPPHGWAGYTRRIDQQMLTDTINQSALKSGLFYICGSSKFVEDMVTLVISLGVKETRIKMERFG